MTTVKKNPTKREVKLNAKQAQLLETAMAAKQQADNQVNLIAQTIVAGADLGDLVGTFNYNADTKTITIEETIGPKIVS